MIIDRREGNSAVSVATTMESNESSDEITFLSYSRNLFIASDDSSSPSQFIIFDGATRDDKSDEEFDVPGDLIIDES